MLKEKYIAFMGKTFYNLEFNMGLYKIVRVVMYGFFIAFLLMIAYDYLFVKDEDKSDKIMMKVIKVSLAIVLLVVVQGLQSEHMMNLRGVAKSTAITPASK